MYPAVPKESAIVSKGREVRCSAFIGTMARESILDKMSGEEKKFKGFPMFFTFENFKKGLFGRHEAVLESALASSSSLLLSSSL
jgi:hypothetical protein